MKVKPQHKADAGGLIPVLIQKVKENPIWALGWSVFTLCLGFQVTQEYTFPEDANYFHHRTFEVNRMFDELERAKKAVAIWSDAISSSTKAVEQMDQSLTAETLAPERIKATTVGLIQEMTGLRNELSKSLVLLKNMYFEKPALQELMPKLLQDVTLLDRILEKRIRFLNTEMTDHDKAATLIPSIISDIEEQRAVLESSTRQPMIDHILERATDEHNDYVRESQSKVKMYKMRSRASLAASGYMGGFVGAAIGWLMYQRRIRRRAPKEKKKRQPSVSDSGGQTIKR